MKTNTINKKEIEKFSRMASEWWDPNGKFKPLHKFNPVRIKYIKQCVVKHFKINRNKLPFKNLEILDVGCGGGLLSEPVSRLGAYVTGIDASLQNIEIAKIHSKEKKLKINYICASPERLKTKKKFDVILNMEIIEHVEDVENFIKQSSKFLKRNGLMFFATINKTLKSYIFAILGAEYILRWLPIGTHDWNKFIKPEELEKLLNQEKFSTVDIKGLNFNPFLNKWKKSNNLSVNYIISSVKN